MICVQLPAPVRDLLLTEFRATADRKYRDRLRIVLMADRGRRPAAVAADLGIRTRTAPRWLNAYLDRGLDGLRPREATGAAPKVPAELAAEVTRWVIEGPAACGLGRANWTYAELADHLFKTHGIAAGRSAVLRFCRKLGVRVYRPTYRFLRADPARQEKARAGLADLRRGPRPAASSC
ncbi:helix-turn-helix domain-containing protein [Gemmata sp. JC717]|uniref:helix-turn-helix domain-containing protein n=1 Tax=Gemmata algarum TaxID=2975278 RepID=UPI0021BB47EF|nr:helix-turn-helix domain-containing protein [Gemmata algarum]MDY3554888.1 helix-turn-helix domain-containing protein [Gemmata algarum]